MKENTDSLLARYFGGNSSEQDMQTLENWISESAENQLYFDELTGLYAKLGTAGKNIPTPDTARAKKTFMAYIAMQQHADEAQTTSKHRSLFKNWGYVAASIALIIALSFPAWMLFKERDVVLATQSDIKEGILSDQTQIQLSKNSKIIYSSRYGKKSRKIKLEGQAFFAVGHKGKGVLQVNAAETLIEDIGTKFSVTAYPDEQEVKVTVAEGKVHFYTASNDGIILSANETGVYNKQNKQFTVVKPEIYQVTKDIKHIEFSSRDLQDALEVVAKEYGIRIRFEEPDIARRKITVNFDGENVDMVLNIIAETLNLEVKKDAEGYLLRNSKLSD